MTERIRFHVDPLCPWAWESSKWIREVEQVRDVEVEWRLFSLNEINDRAAELRDRNSKGTMALRVLGLLLQNGDNRAVGELYRAIGERVHEAKEEFTGDLVKKALVEVGLDESLYEKAWNDESTVDLVLADHQRAVDEAGCFGVPTVVLASGTGMFGPVVTIAPAGEEAGELWDHVSWLAGRDYFYELKRERGDVRPGG